MKINANSDLNSTMTASLSFEAILKEVQTSNLNFRIEMSPFSAVIYLKKTFIRNKLGNPVTPPPPNSLVTQAVKSENTYLAKKVDELENLIGANHQKSNKLEAQLEIKVKEKLDLETLNKKYADKISELEADKVDLKETVKAQADNLYNKKAKADKDKALKFQKSQCKHWKNEYEKEIKVNLKMEKKLKDLETKLVESADLEPENNEPPAKSTVPKSSQTDQNKDITYNVTSPLPPIFSSQLFHHSKRIHFLSNSLPNLSTIAWIRVTEEEKIRDMAEQALSDQYDRQVRAFYDDAREKAEAVRQVYDEDMIGRLFKEND